MSSSHPDPRTALDRLIAEAGQPASSRRTFLKRTCSAVVFMGLATGSVAFVGCDSGGSEPQGWPDGVTLEGTELRIDTTRLPDLARADGFLWIADAEVIVVHDDQLGYRAFSSVCPHEGKPVRAFDGQQLRCPSHGWTFGLDGRPTGRARRGLRTYRLEQDGPQLTVFLA